MSAPETAPAPRLDYLDGLRGWASLMVVLSHLWGQFARHNSDFYSSTPLRLISDGHFAAAKRAKLRVLKRFTERDASGAFREGFVVEAAFERRPVIDDSTSGRVLQ